MKVALGIKYGFFMYQHLQSHEGAVENQGQRPGFSMAPRDLTKVNALKSRG